MLDVFESRLCHMGSSHLLHCQLSSDSILPAPVLSLGLLYFPKLQYVFCWLRNTSFSSLHFLLSCVSTGSHFWCQLLRLSTLIFLLSLFLFLVFSLIWLSIFLPFRARILVSIGLSCSFLFLNRSSQLLSDFPLSTSAFSFLSYLPVTVTEPETVIGKIPSEHKRMTFTHGPRVKFSNNLRFPSPLSCSESISFHL